MEEGRVKRMVDYYVKNVNNPNLKTLENTLDLTAYISKNINGKYPTMTDPNSELVWALILEWMICMEKGTVNKEEAKYYLSMRCNRPITEEQSEEMYNALLNIYKVNDKYNSPDELAWFGIIKALRHHTIESLNNGDIQITGSQYNYTLSNKGGLRIVSMPAPAEDDVVF